MSMRVAVAASIFIITSPLAGRLEPSIGAIEPPEISSVAERLVAVGVRDGSQHANIEVTTLVKLRQALIGSYDKYTVIPAWHNRIELWGFRLTQYLVRIVVGQSDDQPANWNYIPNNSLNCRVGFSDVNYHHLGDPSGFALGGRIENVSDPNPGAMGGDKFGGREFKLAIEQYPLNTAHDYKEKREYIQSERVVCNSIICRGWRDHFWLTYIVGALMGISFGIMCCAGVWLFFRGRRPY